MKSIRSALIIVALAAVVALVTLGAQLRVPTALAFPILHSLKVHAVPSFTARNPVPLGSNTCVGSGCHVSNGSNGSSSVTGFPAGMTYTPGTPMPLTVTINDPLGPRFGYELTARLSSNTATAAGSWTAGTNSNLGTNGVPVVQGLASTSTFNLTWTPPATASGNVNFYLTGWSGSFPSGDGYTAMYTLTPAAAAPDFGIAGSATTLTVVQGSASSADTITVTPKNGFTGSVALTASGLPSGVTATFTPASTTTTSSLTFAAGSTAATGTSTVTITGTSGSLTHTTTVSLTVNAAPDFSLSASPNSVSITQGNSGTDSVTVNPLNGFTNSVSLSASGLPAGVTASFSPASTTTTSTLTLTSSSTATTGTATVTITGTSGGLSHTTTFSLTVNAASVPNFGLSASPSSLTFIQGSSGTNTITVTPQNGFTSSVSLSASGLPTGVTASFSPASATTTSTLTLAASSTATTGTATVTITGTSGSLSHTTTVSLTVNAAPVPDFSLSASPSLTFIQGSSGTSTVTVKPVNGFSSGVNLSASGLPTGVTASFNPPSATTTSMLTLTASSSATTGPATVTITGTSGNLSHTTSLSITVNAAPVPTFSLSAAPASVSVSQGSSGTSTVTVTPQNGFSAGVGLSASGLPSGVTASFSPASATTTSTLTLTASSSAATGTSTVIVTGTSGSLSQTATLSLTVNAPPSTLKATPAAVTFNYQIGTPAPAAQPVNVTASPAQVAFTASVSDGTWMSATPTSSSTPATLNIAVNPSGLQPGAYPGTVSITSAGALGSPQIVQVTLVVTTEKINTSTTASSYPNLVIDGAGNFNVAWRDSTAGVVFSRSINQGSTFTNNVVIPGSSGAAFQPQVVVDPTGNNVYVAWAAASTTAGSSDVYVSHSTNGGTTFPAATKLTLGPVPLADGPRMAVDSSGVISVVWGRDEADITQSNNVGGSFFTPIKISTNPQNSGGPRVAVNSQGTVYVVWTDEANKNASGSYCSSPVVTGVGVDGKPIYSNTMGGNIYVNITAKGSTPSPTPSTVGGITYGTRSLSATDWQGANADWPNGFFGCSYDNLQLLVDSGDNVHLVWADDLPDQNVFASAYPLIVNAQGTAKFSFPSILTNESAASPYAVLDQTRNVNVVWSGGPTGGATSAGIFYSRSTDNIAPFGMTFTIPVTVAPGGTSPEFPQVGVDPSGDIDVAWQQDNSAAANAFDVFFARSFDGGASFSTTSAPVSVSPSTQCLNDPTITTAQVPPPPFTTCGSVQVGVDSGSMSDLVWISRSPGTSNADVLFERMTMSSPLPPSPDFYMLLPAPAQTGSSGARATYALTLTALYGFANPVTLTCSGLPAGASCTANPVTPTGTGAGASVTVTVAGSVVAGSYAFTITGTAPTATHSVQATLIVGSSTGSDFTVGLTPASQAVMQGGNAVYSMNIASAGGFGGVVAVTWAGLPAGVNCSSSPTTVTPPGTANVSCMVPGTLAQGIYSFTLTGSSGSISHSQTASLAVGTLTATVAPSTSSTVPVGSSAAFTITVSSTNNASGLVSFGCGGLVAGVACTFSPTSINVTGTATPTTLTVSVNTRPAAAPGGWFNLRKVNGQGVLALQAAFAALLLMAMGWIAIGRRTAATCNPLTRGLAILAIVLISVAMVSCTGLVGSKSSGTPGGSSPVTTQVTVQGQTGSTVMTLTTLSIMVP